MRVLAIGCANGLGHVRRLVGILERLSEIVSGVEVELLCEAWQVERLRGWSSLEGLLGRGLTTTFGIVSPGVEWRLDRDGYSDENLLAWEERLVEHAPLHDADLVLADNLGAVTDSRPDVVLSGSFLWSDVLASAHPGCKAIDRFVERERALLERHRPMMLCVDALATPGVLERTAAVPLPWMCELDDASELPRRPGGRPGGRHSGRHSSTRIGIATGASAVSERRIHELAAELAAQGARRGWTIAVPAPEGRPLSWERKAGLAARPNVVPFRYAADDYASADLIICRPGAGALTQCVTHGVPMLCLREPRSPEMAHNARRIETLGLGVDLGEDPSVTTLLDAIDTALAPDRHERFRQSLDRQPKDGLARAATYLADRPACLAAEGSPSG